MVFKALLAEMKRFELLRRFKPTYRISSADPSATWVHLRICQLALPVDYYQIFIKAKQLFYYAIKININQE